MSLSALALVVLAGLIHAIWNIAAKKAGGDVRFVAFSSLLMMVIWSAAGPVAGLERGAAVGHETMGAGDGERRGACVLLHHPAARLTANRT